MGVDQQKAEMTVETFNPSPGNWTVLVCSAFPDNPGDHDYAASVTVKTTCRQASHCPVPPKPKPKPRR